MNNELICTPVAIKKQKYTEVCHDLWQQDDGKYFMYSTDEGDLMPDSPIELYLVSDEEIKEGDWVVNTENDIPIVYKSTALSGVYNTRKKIISTTDKSLSIPPIPVSFIEWFVREQSKIGKVRVKIGEVFNSLADYATGKPKVPSLLLNEKNEVIILPIENKTYNREEALTMLKSFAEYMESGSVTSFKGFYTNKPLDQQDWHPIGDIINEWFYNRY